VTIMRRAHMTSARVGASHATLTGGMTVPAVPWISAAVLIEGVLAWVERVRQRRHLGELSDHMLKDIGLSRADVESEIGKPFWRQ
jgi:uncharacterized protein YjiS (DUF1127 family)